MARNARDEHAEHVHQHLDARPGVGRVLSSLGQPERQQRTDDNGSAHDQEETERDRRAVERAPVRHIHSDPSGRRQARAQDERHRDLLFHYRPQRIQRRRDRPRRHATDHLDGALVPGVAARPDQHR